MTGLSSSQLARLLCPIIVAITSWGALCNSATAQFLVINDCNGFTRAVEKVGSDARNVQFEVAGSEGGNVSGARVSLTNNATGEIRFAAAQGGKVHFGNVMPGIYTVATEQTGLILSSISFSPLPILGVAGSTLVGGAVVGGGAAGGIIGVDAIVKATDGDPGSPPTPTPTPTPEPTPDECSVCDPDANPPPLDESDFADAFEQSSALSPSR